MTRSTLPVLLFVLGAVGTVGAQVSTEFVRDGTARRPSFSRMEYPAVARTARVQGAVVVRTTLNKKGEVSDALALSGGSIITEAAVANAKKWTFEPGPTTLIMVYLFELDGACTGPDTFFRMGNAANVVRITACSDDGIK